MTTTYNLLDQPWIPVDNDQKMGLLDVLVQAHMIRSIDAETPITSAALLRLLMAIVYRIYPDMPSRRALWRSGQFNPDRLQDYLEQWRYTFDLFDKQRPFLQDPHVPERGETPINKMLIHQASGSTVTLVDHHIDGQVSIPYDEAARGLVTSLAFGLSGLSGITNQSFSSGPWAYRMVFLLRGETLFHTILLNLLPAEMYPGDLQAQALDAPMWEQTNPWGIDRSLPLGPLDYLSWPSRAPQLLPDPEKAGMVSTLLWHPGGLKKWPLETRDPYMAAMGRSTGEGTYAMRAEYAYDLSAQCLGAILDPEQRPLNVGWAEDLHQRGTLQDTRVDVWCVGVAGDQGKVDGQPSIQVPYYFDPTWQETMRQAIALAQRGLEIVGKRAYGVAKGLISKEGQRLSNQQRDQIKKTKAGMEIETRFWGALEPDWNALISGTPLDWTAAVVEAMITVSLSLDTFRRGDSAQENLRQSLLEQLQDDDSAT